MTLIFLYDSWILMDLGILVALTLRETFFWTASTTWWSSPGNISERRTEARGKFGITLNEKAVYL